MQRLYPGQPIPEIWDGHDVFTAFVLHRHEFWFMTSETPQTFESMLQIILPSLQNGPRLLSPRNKLLMTLIWLRHYPTYAIVSLMFNISVTSVYRIVEEVWMVMLQHFAPHVRWPTRNEWEQQVSTWPEMPYVVGAIDGTSHRILIPQVNQQLFYSGHRTCHCVHTQVNWHITTFINNACMSD